MEGSAPPPSNDPSLCVHRNHNHIIFQSWSETQNYKTELGCAEKILMQILIRFSLFLVSKTEAAKEDTSI